MLLFAGLAACAAYPKAARSMHGWHAFVRRARITSYQVWQRRSTARVVRIRV